MRVLAIDPGNEQSAYVLYADDKPINFGKVPNKWLLDRVRYGSFDAGLMAVEMIASYGMPVGREVFDTCLFIGQLMEAWQGEQVLIYRRDVKLHLCGQARAKDGNIRQALIDRFGPGKQKAIGNKKSPGPLYGVSADVWSALAVAVTYADSQTPQKTALSNSRTNDHGSI